MFENLYEQYGQFIIMGIVFLVGALVYGGYLYYQKQQNIDDINNNLQKQPQPPQQPPQPPQQPPQPPQKTRQPPDFVPSDTFKGEQRGYSFKNGPKGQGYYKE